MMSMDFGTVISIEFISSEKSLKALRMSLRFSTAMTLKADRDFSLK